VILAEPGSLIGFVGPRVIEMTMSEKVPPESHRAEFLYRSGMVDLIVPRPELRGAVAYLIGHLGRDARVRPGRPRAARGVVKRRPPLEHLRGLAAAQGVFPAFLY
jgi:acetyl-CoA carboxylase carboxyl transferase subunit beta